MSDSSINIFTEEQQNYVSSIPENLLRGHLLHVIRMNDIITNDRDKALEKIHYLESINADLTYRLNGGFKNG